MVSPSSVIPTTRLLTKTLSFKRHRFVDSALVKFIGGRGGDGCISMLHEFCNEFAGPDGGNGGHGGHIVLRASDTVKSLNLVQPVYRGHPGVRGMGKNLYGKNASHQFVDVPVGTIVCKPHDNDYEVVAELDQNDSMFIAARGGAGGRGNHSYWSNENRHPRVAQAGAKGDVNEYELRMKVYAHFGLIGLPNAGKSSLLKALTRANVKIGDYAFTTLNPQVGVICYNEMDFSQVAISDLPGLVSNSGRVLRNIQKCPCLIYVIDMIQDPIDQMDRLVGWLESFREGISKRPNIVVGTKVDDTNASQNLEHFREYIMEKMPNSRFIEVSSERGMNLDELRQEIRTVYDDYVWKSEAPLIW